MDMDGRADNVVTAGAAGLSAMLPVVRWGEMAPEGGVCAMTAEQHARLDELERRLHEAAEADGKRAHQELGLNEDVASHEHFFFPGLYVRVMHLKAGSVATSLMHGREHPYTILKGSFVVSDGGGPGRIVRAGYLGRTLPGTRRAVIALEDVTWATFHVNPGDSRDLDEIMREHTVPYVNRLLPVADEKDELNDGGVA